MLKLLVISFIKFYQKYISFLFGGGKCKFNPTCSQYCIDAIKKKGVFVGLFLCLFRVAKCNPYSSGGDDFVK